jgi:YD repeat-containing protein
MNRLASFISSAALLLVALGGCAEETSLAAASCPCTEGFTCCAEANVCVAAGALCPLEDWQVDDGPGLDLAWHGLGNGVCAGTLDLGSDGTIDRTWTITPTLVGLELERDEDADGTFDSIEHLDVFAGGRLARWSTLGSTVAHVWRYDIDGRLDSASIVDPDGSLDSSVSWDPREQDWSYYQDGHTEVDIDFDGNGVVDRRRVLYKDALDRVIVEEDYIDDTGHLPARPTQVLTRTFGPHGPTKLQYSSDKGWKWTLYDYDANGRSIGERTYLGSGALASEVVKTRDALGRITRRQLIQYDPFLAEYLPGSTYDYRYDCDGAP